MARSERSKLAGKWKETWFLHSLITMSDSELTRYFFAIILLLSSAHVFGYLFLSLGIPRVSGYLS